MYSIKCQDHNNSIQHNIFLYLKKKVAEHINHRYVFFLIWRKFIDFAELGWKKPWNNNVYSHLHVFIVSDDNLRQKSEEKLIVFSFVYQKGNNRK